MKTMCILLVLIAATTVCCVGIFADGLVTGGLTVEGWVSGQLSGQYQAALSSSVNTGFGGGIGIDYQFLDYVELGVGAQGQLPRSQTSYPGGFDFQDFFLSIRLLFKTAFATLYPVCRVGYGIFLGDENFTGSNGIPIGGLYYAIGLGLRSPTLQLPVFGWTHDFYAFIEGAYESNSGYVYNSAIGGALYSTPSIYIGVGTMGWGSPVNESAP